MAGSRLMSALVLAMAAGGCLHNSSTYRPLIVAVRDGRTHEPVPRAMIDARPVHLFIPEHPYAIVLASPPRSARAITGNDGIARLDAVVDYPMEVVVVRPGYDTVVLQLAGHPAVVGDGGWIRPGDDETLLPAEARPELEIRFRPD